MSEQLVQEPLSTEQPADEPVRGKVLLVCSPGGHLQDMLALAPSWEGFERVWVTNDAVDVPALLVDERVHLCHGPTNRSLKMLLKNLPLAFRIVRRERPDAILSTGAALALPLFLAGRFYGARLIFVECMARVKSLSMTGWMVYPLAHQFYVQWPEAARGRKARYVGGLL